MSPPRPAPERAVYRRDPALPGLDMLDATFVTHRFSPHVHDTYAIGVCLAGAEGFQHGRRSYVLRPGQVVTVNPDEVHTGEAATPEGWEYRMFYPHPDLVRRLLGLKDGIVPRFPGPLAEDPEAADGLARLHFALCSPSALPLAMARSAIFTEAFAGLFRRHARIPPPQGGACPQGLTKARARMLDDPAADLSLDELSATAGLSPWHFLRSFKSCFGLTPHALLVQMRCHRAAGLLRTGTPPAQAAAEAGFTDQSHLTRHFKRIYGVPPARYGRGNFVQEPPSVPC